MGLQIYAKNPLWRNLLQKMMIFSMSLFYQAGPYVPVEALICVIQKF